MQTECEVKLGKSGKLRRYRRKAAIETALATVSTSTTLERGALNHDTEPNARNYRKPVELPRKSRQRRWLTLRPATWPYQHALLCGYRHTRRAETYLPVSVSILC